MQVVITVRDLLTTVIKLMEKVKAELKDHIAPFLTSHNMRTNVYTSVDPKLHF